MRHNERQASRIRATIASRKSLPLTEADLDVVDRLKTDADSRDALARLNGQNPADLDDVSESVLLHALFQAGAAALRATEQDLGYQPIGRAIQRRCRSAKGEKARTRLGRRAVNLLRGGIYRAQPPGFPTPHYFLVVSNDRRNRALGSALVVRCTTTAKPRLDSIVQVPKGEPLGGWIVCDDIYELFADEILSDHGALSPPTMRRVDAALKAALGL